MATTVSYTIQPGDSLSSIARDKLGDTSRWQDIYNLNKTIISNPDVVTAGMVIQLPHSASASIQNAVVKEIKPTNFLLYAAAGAMALSLLPIFLMRKKKRTTETLQ